MKLLRLKAARSYSLLFVALLFSYSASSQLLYDTHPDHPGHERCTSVKMDSIRHANNPDLQTNEEFEEWIEKLIAEKKKRQAQGLIINGVYQIPIVVHVVHNGEPIGTGRNLSVATIQSQIDVMNEDFRRIFGTNGYNTHPDGADTEIEFCLARRRPDGSAFPAGEDGINRVNGATQFGGGPTYGTGAIDGTIKPWFTATQFGGWSPADYMNFWSIDLQGGLLGYAQFPTTVLGGMGCNAQNVVTDGVVMDYQTIGKSAVTGFPGPFNEGRTATHEVGHWLGLRHIWGDGGCGVDDFCLDTPESDASNGGCPTGHVSCGTVDMIENYMDYTNDLCMNIFTNDQKMRMRTVLENSPIRASLITSDACIPPSPSDASITGVLDPDGDNCVGSITPTVVLRNRGGTNLTSATIAYTLNNGTPTTFAWTGSIAPGAENNVVLPAFTAPLGVHDFRAYSTLPNGVTDPDPTYDTTLISFAVSNGIQPDYAQDFEGGTFPPDVRWSVDNPNGDCYEWVGQACVSSTGASNNIAAQMTNFNNGTNQDEYLYTPFFILPCNASAANVSFDKAYRRRITGSNDRLRLEMSDDCGATWSTVLFDQSGGTLDGPNGTSNSYWVPTTAGEWQNVNIDLMPYVTGTSQSVQFRFRATNAGNGGNLYVDNFDFTATTPGEIEVTAVTTNVLDGGYYDFGPNPIAGTVTTVFTISNTGTSNLVLTGPITITGATEFALNTSFGTTTVPAGGSTTFSIDFTASGAGPFIGNVSFGTNDCDEGVYNFQIEGTGDVVPPIADFTAAPTVICSGQTVTFADASTAAATLAWSFPGGTPNTATGAGPHVITYNTGGTYNAQLTATNGFGSDVELKTNLITVLGSSALPITEGFAGAFVPAGWSISNGGNQAITWTQDPNNNGNAPTAGNSARIDLFSTNTTGDQDSLFVIPADLTGFSSAQMTFDVAYARYNGTLADSLEVIVSPDCGVSWFLEYSKGPNSNLATEPDQTAPYTAPGTWRNETVDLTGYVGNSNVRVAFVSVSGYGQYLYLDNVNLTGVTGGCNDPDVPTVTFTPAAYCDGDMVTLNIAGNLNDATQWAIYSGSCGGTLLGTSTTGTFDVTLTAGANDFFVRGEGGCVTPGTCGIASVSAGAIPAITSGTVTNPTSCGGNDGTIVINGAGSGVVTWTGTASGNSGTVTLPYTITGLAAGSYTISFDNGCPSNTLNESLADPAAPAAPTVSVVDNCGSSTLTATGSNLVWSTGATTASITVTSAGTYTVTQTVGGCTSPAGSGVANPTATPPAPSVSVVDNCGSSTLTATGSNLVWSTGATTASITVTSAGTYTVTQTVGGCTSPAGSGVANPTSNPSAPTVSVVDNCGSSTLTATGSNLVWSTGATTASITVTSVGTYTVTQTVGGCTSPAGSGVANPTSTPSAPTVSVVDNCGSSTLTATGSNLVWSTGATTASITVTSTGTYTVTQTVGGCTSPAGSGVANPTATPSVPTVSVVDNCGSSTLTATGSNLVWSTGATTASIAVTTSGPVTVTQTVGGCVSAPGTGVANPLTVPAPVSVSATDCGSYTWSATGTTYSTSGSYTTTLSAANGCDSVVTLNLTINNATSGAETIAACQSYTWSANGTMYTTSGVYTAVLTGSNGCDSTATLTLTINNSVTATDVISACDSYMWIDGNTYTASNNTTSYIIAGGAANGCDSIVNLDLTINNSSTGSEVVSVCDSYFWPATGLAYSTTGMYTANLTNAAGCDSVVTLDLTVTGLPNVTFDVTPDTLCLQDPDVTIGGATPASGTFTGVGVTGGMFSPATAGEGAHVITYTYTDVNGCTSIVTDQLVVQNCASIKEIENNSVSIYPNPTSGILTVVSKGADLEELRIFDNSGKLIDAIHLSGTLDEIDLSNYPTGVYQFQIKAGTSLNWERIIKN